MLLLHLRKTALGIEEEEGLLRLFFLCHRYGLRASEKRGAWAEEEEEEEAYLLGFPAAGVQSKP